MSDPRKPRVLIVGIDGCDWAITGHLLDAGLLPNLKALASGGAFGPVRSTIPPVTPPAWTTLMTGKNPGKHGVFDFLPMTGERFDVPIAERRQAGTIWSALSRAGYSVGSFNLPATYPPENLSAFQVSGFDTPGFGPAMAQPEGAFEALREAVGEYELFPVSIQNPQGDPEALQLHSDLPVGGTRALLSRFPCDVYMVSFQVVDWVHHGALGREMSPGRPESLQPDGAVTQAYRLVDAAVGELVREWVGDTTTVMVISDHGGASADRLVNLEKVFLDHGLMAYAASSAGDQTALEGKRSRARLALRAWTWLKRALPWAARLAGPLARSLRGHVADYQQHVEVDWSRTKAAPWGEYGQVRLNIAGRDPQGIVPQAEVPALSDEIEQILLGLRDPETGQPVYAEIVRGDQVYTGPFTPEGPDIVAIPSGERYLTVSARSGHQALPLLDVQPEPVTVLEPAWGTHSNTGVLMLSGPDVEPGVRIREASLQDVTPTLLYLLDEPVPEDMDGHPLLDAFRQQVRDARAVRTCEPWPAPERDGDQAGYTDEEREAMEERLRSLGYM